MKQLRKLLTWDFIPELEDGKLMYDAQIGSKVLVRCPVLCLLEDNPRASEFKHHVGSSASMFCRKYKVRHSYGFYLLLSGKVIW